ncbi:hypothetical protein WJX84_008052, partial [Apatococcus fuscideae]
GMEFNMDLSIFNYDLAQKVAQVVLGSIPASSNFDAIIYTEEGFTPQAQTVRITVKFYDGDMGQINALYDAAPSLGQLTFPTVLGPLNYRPKAYTGTSLNPFVNAPYSPSPPPLVNISGSPSPPPSPPAGRNFFGLYGYGGYGRYGSYGTRSPPSPILPPRSPPPPQYVVAGPPVVRQAFSFERSKANLTSPSTAQTIPVVNLRMEFNMNLSLFTYDLAQQVARVILANVSATSNMDATIYTEAGDTNPGSSQFICITAKFYDGDGYQQYQLYSVGAMLGKLSFPAVLGPLLPPLPTPPYRPPVYVGLSLNPFAGASSPPPPSTPSPTNIPVFFPGLSYVYRKPESAKPVNPPSLAMYIPVVNIRMEFNLDLSNLTFQLAQQTLDVILQDIPTTSDYEATLYTEQGSTATSRFIYVTAKFFDGDTSQVNSLLRNAPYLGQAKFLQLPATLGQILSTPVTYSGLTYNPFYVQAGPLSTAPPTPSQRPRGNGGYGGYGHRSAPGPVYSAPSAYQSTRTFTPDLEQALVDSVQSSLSRAANVNISLANIVSGSVNLVVETVFLDANEQAAAQLLNNAKLLASAPAPDAAPVVTAESIPVVTLSYALPDLTLDSFTPDLKQDLVDAIIDALPASSNVDVYLTNIQSGSVTFDTVISFLDGNADTAQALSDSVAASATAPGPTQPKPATVSFEISLSSYTVDSFTDAVKTAFKATLIEYLRLSTNQVTVDLQDIRPGSIIFNTVVTFLNGDITAAATLLATIQQASQESIPCWSQHDTPQH